MFTTRRKPVRRLNPMVNGLEGRELLSFGFGANHGVGNVAQDLKSRAPVTDVQGGHGGGNVALDIKSRAPVTDVQGGHGGTNIIAIL